MRMKSTSSGSYLPPDESTILKNFEATGFSYPISLLFLACWILTYLYVSLSVALFISCLSTIV